MSPFYQTFLNFLRVGLCRGFVRGKKLSLHGPRIKSNQVLFIQHPDKLTYTRHVQTVILIRLDAGSQHIHIIISTQAKITNQSI
jgi:hypothetical protein